MSGTSKKSFIKYFKYFNELFVYMVEKSHSKDYFGYYNGFAYLFLLNIFYNHEFINLPQRSTTTM